MTFSVFPPQPHPKVNDPNGIQTEGEDCFKKPYNCSKKYEQHIAANNASCHSYPAYHG